jgi:hypothetical protein
MGNSGIPSIGRFHPLGELYYSKSFALSQIAGVYSRRSLAVFEVARLWATESV